MSTIDILFNGQRHTVAQGFTLDDAMRAFAARAMQDGVPVATAVNGRHVARQARADIVLNNDDAVTTFEPITGG
ncbi:thiamine biosynthesis protein ThiS [Pusillimonas sp. TS35]|uniref:sulfur carrier protein ThiS n=1 Tax=Paracandidimonas lactea TaxID=2895524 RepID=UPI001370FF74|nr:thiamine biosynthesis protein ThiS [Pusillimonas sp. TS35]